MATLIGNHLNVIPIGSDKHGNSPQLTELAASKLVQWLRLEYAAVEPYLLGRLTCQRRLQGENLHVLRIQCPDHVWLPTRLAVSRRAPGSATASESPNRSSWSLRTM